MNLAAALDEPLGDFEFSALLHSLGARGHKNVVFWSVFLFTKTKIINSAGYGPKSLQSGQSAQFGGRLDVSERRRPWVEIQ